MDLHRYGCSSLDLLCQSVKYAQVPVLLRNGNVRPQSMWKKIITNILHIPKNQGLRDIIFAFLRFGAPTIPQSKAYLHIAQSEYKYIYIYIKVDLLHFVSQLPSCCSFCWLPTRGSTNNSSCWLRWIRESEENATLEKYYKLGERVHRRLLAVQETMDEYEVYSRWPHVGP